MLTASRQVRQQRIDSFTQELIQVRDQMISETHEQSPVQVFLTKLRALLDSGRAMLTPRDKRADECSKPVLGYYLGDSGQIGLVMDEAIRQVAGMLPDGRFPCSKNTLLAQLEHEGVVVQKSHQPRGAGGRLPRLAVIQGDTLRGESIRKFCEESNQAELRDRQDKLVRESRQRQGLAEASDN